MTNRYTDAYSCPSHRSLPPLPVVDWSLIGKRAPALADTPYGGSTAPLPKADVVVITWTTAEWSAMDHVFLSSDQLRYLSSRDFEKAWHLYARDAPESDFSKLWGYYRMVNIENAAGKTLDVLLFKSNAHLAHPPWISGLLEMMDHIITDAKPDRVYSIGTAGGSSEDERLGDTAITNSGHIQLQKPENDGVSWNNTTVTCKSWYPSLDLFPAVGEHLLYPMAKVVTQSELDYLICRLHQKNAQSADYGYDDLVNAPISPSNLKQPKGLDKKDVPLLTTDYYFIATGDDAAQYCVLEMDDAVIGYAAGEAGVDYAFVRNVSDPLVPATSASGATIPSEVREDWSSLVYETCGFYTAFNGALLTWATIAGDSG